MWQLSLQLVSLVADDWTEISLNAWANWSPRLCCGTLGGFGGMFSILSQAVDSAALPLTSCLYRASTLVKGTSVGPFQVFPKHVPSPRNLGGLLNFQECFSQLPEDIPSQIFLSFWSVSCLPIIQHLRQPQNSLIAYNCFQQSPLGIKLSYWISSESIQIQTVLKMGSSRKPLSQPNNDNFLEMLL